MEVPKRAMEGAAPISIFSGNVRVDVHADCPHDLVLLILEALK